MTIAWYAIKGGGSEGRATDGRTFRITSTQVTGGRLFTAYTVNPDNRMEPMSISSSQMNVVKARIEQHIAPPSKAPVTAPPTPKGRPLTTDEIRLYRDVLDWCRANNVSFQQHNGRWMEPTEYRPIHGPIVGRSVEIWNRYGTWELGIDAHGGSRTPDVTWHKAVSLTKSIDLLVHLEMLPRRFHSAYRAGWHASRVWHDPQSEPDSTEFRRLFHDIDNISFPAGVTA
jgi:hypothetical protein